VSGDRYRWAELAQDLRFHQLEAVRKQAEAWRTGLTGLTALFGAVLVLKGRESVADLARPYPALILALLLAALAALVMATLSALRAASGMPGDECLLTGEDLEAWTRAETTKAQQSIRRARWLTLVGIGAMAVAIGVAWLAPSKGSPEPTVVVQSVDGLTTCGDLAAIGNGGVAVRHGTSLSIIPLGKISRLEYAEHC
jgi:hypothetical protein